jgi:hypothetical protein
LFDFDYTPKNQAYLRRTGKRRRRCYEYERNPDWNGILKNRAQARSDDPETSHDAAESIPEGDVWEAKLYADAFMQYNGKTIVSVELREYVIKGIEEGSIDSLGWPAHIRAESIRRRFSDLCIEH